MVLLFPRGEAPALQLPLVKGLRTMHEKSLASTLVGDLLPPAVDHRELCVILRLPVSIGLDLILVVEHHLLDHFVVPGEEHLSFQCAVVVILGVLQRATIVLLVLDCITPLTKVVSSEGRSTREEMCQSASGYSHGPTGVKLAVVGRNAR